MSGSRLVIPKLVTQGKQRLVDVLYGQILEQIVSGALQEGDRLPSEHQICQQWNVSRPTVREALMRLRADGLVMARQGAGTFVSKRPSDLLIRLATVSDVPGLLRCMEVRSALEGQAAGFAALRRTPEQMAAIERALHTLGSALDGGAASAEEDFAFHVAVAEASGNGMFVGILQLLGAPVKHAMSVALGITQATSRARGDRVFSEHQAVAEAIAAGDVDAATLCMRHHLHRARQRIMDRQRDK